MLAPAINVAGVDVSERRDSPAVSAVLVILNRYSIRADKADIASKLFVGKAGWVDLARLANLLRCFGLMVFVRQHTEYHRLIRSPNSLVLVVHQINGESAFSFVKDVNSAIVLMDARSRRTFRMPRVDFEKSWWGKAYCLEIKRTIHYHRWSMRCYLPRCPN